mgnify:FL=1
MKKCLPTLLAAALALGLAACGQQTDSKTASDSTSQAAGEQIKLSSKAGEITIPANVSKIAVMDYTSLDTFVALGASDKVIGLPLSSAVPSSLASFKDGKYADFGAVNNVNLEKLAAAQPQLVISADRLQKQTDALKQIAPTYHYSIDTNNYWQSFHEQTLNLAKIVGKTTEAEQKLQALDAEAAKLSEKTKGKTALIVLVNNDKLMAFGQHSRFGLIHDKLGFTPADASIKVGTHGQSISYEYIAEKNPDYLFVIDRASAVTGKSGGAQAALNNDIVKQSKAAKENHIVYLDANNWYLMNGGLNAMHEMVAEVGNAIK